MFGDNFYAEFQVETVYNDGDFPNALDNSLGYYIPSTDSMDGIAFGISSAYSNKNDNVYFLIGTLDGEDSPDSFPFITGKYRIEGNLEIVQTTSIPENFYISGNSNYDPSFYWIKLNNNNSNKYAYGYGYDATTKEFVVYFYSFNGSNYNYEGLCRFDMADGNSASTVIQKGLRFALSCTDSKNPKSPTDAPCVNVKANFGSEEFLFPDIAEPYQYEMKELHITENPDIDVYINDKGPKTDTVKVRKGSDVKIEAKAKDESLQDYVRIYVTPES